MSELLHALGIQWSVLLAQVVNFAILVFVLAKFVYKPLLAVVDRRRALIAESMEKVKEIDRHKEQIDGERADILRKADVEAGALLQRAKDEAEAMRAEIERAAAAHAQQIVQKGMAQLELERAKVVKDIQDRLAHTIVASAEKILRREFSKEDQDAFELELKLKLPNLLS